MKNGRAMRGHRRVMAMVGTRVTTRRAPTGGWHVTCACGWDGGHYPASEPARMAYRKHLDEAIDLVPRTCRRCGETKLASEMADRWSRHVCRSCYSAHGNEWARAHPEASARHKRNHHLLMKFGITADEADAVLESQGGACAICKRAFTDKARGREPHVDHDHVSGQVRGILCFGCNVGLGAFSDEPDRLREAIDYLGRGRS